jgi:hypothetical protein
VSRTLALASLVFLAFASGVLVWEGLATGVGPRHALARGDVWRARFRFTLGMIVLAMVLWIASGLLTRAW